ncbi:PEGA domain-containing protein [Fontimonas sp. SYSU GA230001]|uniref:PEGA domain-containing protein n=1 Tax=Fontimonas sp. SYSU GA230001 TaxID=3142450 RepID=UPI0032B58432
MNREMPALASVFYLRLVDFSSKPVAEQARQRARLEGAIGAALALLAPETRAVLDAADGSILVVLADPAAGLAAAQACLAAAGDLPLSVGGNHGPVALVEAEGGGVAMVGDGIRSAAAVAAFAGRGEILLTSGYRDALDERAPERTAALRRAGVIADASIRTHELYAPDPTPPRQRRVRLWVAAAAMAGALVASGVALRGTVPSLGLLAPTGLVTFDVSPGGEVFVDGEARGRIPPLRELALPAGTHRVEVRHGDDEPYRIDIDLAHRQTVALRHAFPPPAIVRFDITPGGEVFVDGRSRGAAPALQELELSPGPHRVEVRHPDYAPHATRIDLKPGERFVLRHVFMPPAVLVFEISPGGQVLLDGALQGSLPDLRRLEVKAGRHLIEVRYGDYEPLQMDVTLAAGEQVVIRHRFGGSKPAELFRKLKKSLGL